MRAAKYTASIFVVLTLFFLQNTLTAQNFEYALSKQEFSFGKIQQIELFDDKMVVAGSVETCQYPLIYLFDTTGQFISYKYLDIGNYEVGYVSSLHYEDTVILALASVQQALIMEAHRPSPGS
jgi:hypothetical protein